MKVIGHKIAVIGSGIAGLAAAGALSDRGHHVSCFEKSRGVGGRMSSRRMDGFEFDHGAQYFTGRDDRFVNQIPSWINSGVIAEWRAKIVTLSDGIASARKQQTRFVGVPGMTGLAKHLAGGLNTTASALITGIEHNADGWKLKGDDAVEHGPFDRLLLSVPAMQARTLLQSVLSQIERSSVQPDGLASSEYLRSGIATLLHQMQPVEMEPCWAVMTGFDRRVDIDFDGAFVQNSPIGWIARNNSKPGRSSRESWVLHATAEWSKKHLEDPVETVGQSLLGEFNRLTKNANAPLVLQAHRWRYARAVSPLRSGVVGDRDLGIALCGDWCSGTRVEDAWLSGVAAADKLCQGLA